MAGVTAAWELSRPGWRDRFDRITVYQRGWYLGGKGASTRGPDGRILEHGLHVWLGYYDNAFRLVRECYEELDRGRTDPECPIRTWRDAFVPSTSVGVFEHVDGTVDSWLAQFGTNELVPGSPGGHSSDLTDIVRRTVALANDLVRSARGGTSHRVSGALDLVATVLRGMSADGLLRRPGGFDRIDDEDLRDWLRRHGAADATVDGGLVRGMYDLVFAYRSGDHARPAFPAGLGVFLAIRMFLDFKGALFWKMTAGMGDVVFAPLHEALVRRGVDIRYFHEVESICPSADGRRVEAIGMTRQVSEEAIATYQPVQRVNGIPCFPAVPAVDQRHRKVEGSATLDSPVAAEGEPLVLRHGVDFDDVVVAISLGALPVVAADIVRQDARWQAMIENVHTVPTWSAQLWLRADEAALGWRHPGATMSGLDADFDTYASMSHLIGIEDWPKDDAPRALAYLCSVLDQPEEDVQSRARAFVRDWSPTLWPRTSEMTLDCREVRAHHVVANTDPSDRYVQSMPGSNRHRLRVDESGLDNLVLAGDWTNCGLNAGCIEAAVISGIQAAAVVEGRPLCDRVMGPLTWDWG